VTPHADHVGSLLRPASLLESRRRYASGEISVSDLRSAEDAAIEHVLDLQREAGIRIFSDGELRRSSWLGGFRDMVRGLVPSKVQTSLGAWQGPHREEANREIPVPSMAVGGKLTIDGRFTDVETAFLRKHAPGPFKITMPSPTMLMHLWQPGISDAIYPDRDAMTADIVGIYEREVDAQTAEGVPYIQLDSLRYVDLIDEQRQKLWSAVGLGRVLDEVIAADNRVLARAKAATRAVHICRGNHRSSWAAKGGYEAVAERLFGELDTDRFLLEFDDERSGGFEPLRFVPKGKTVVLGLITTKSPELESQDTLLRRIDEAAKFVPLDHLAIGTQCGFASTERGNLLSEDDERRKLALVAETAVRVWGTA